MGAAAETPAGTDTGCIMAISSLREEATLCHILPGFRLSEGRRAVPLGMGQSDSDCQRENDLAPGEVINHTQNVCWMDLAV